MENSRIEGSLLMIRHKSKTPLLQHEIAHTTLLTFSIIM